MLKIFYRNSKFAKKNHLRDYKYAFTMAEVLITLGIIGIIAAMTIPAIMGKYQKKTTVAKLKKAYSTLNQMVLRAQEDNGPANLPTTENIDAKSVEKFFKTYWLPYFNHPVVSRSKNSYVEYIYTGLNGASYIVSIVTKYDAGRIYFTTSDGVSYYINILRWEYIYDDDGNKHQIGKYSTRQNVYVDINGAEKGPNIFGKDVFMFIIDFDKNTVRPNGYNESSAKINSNCNKNNDGTKCAAKIMQDGWEIIDDYPW